MDKSPLKSYYLKILVISRFCAKIKIIVLQSCKAIRQIDYINKEYIMAPMQLEEDEMPPVVEIKEYGNLKKKSL